MKRSINEALGLLEDYIVSHAYEETPILTVYANIDPTDEDNRKERPAWMIELKNEAKQLAEKLGAEALKRRDTRRTWDEAEELIMAHLQDRKPEGRSVVIFTDLEDYLTVDLPVPLPTKIYYGLPQLKHLLFALDCYKKFRVILYSEEEARQLDVFLNSPTDRTVVPLGGAGGVKLRPGGRTARTQASERRDLDSKRRVVKEAVNDIHADLLADAEVERLIFGGNLKIAHAVKKQLHPSVADSLVTIEPIALKSSDNEIAEQVARIADEYEREHDLALVQDLVSRQHACGRAILERQGVLSALTNGQARSLVVAMPMESDEFDPLLIQAVLNNAEIEFVHGEAAEQLNKFGGIAAKLYFSGA